MLGSQKVGFESTDSSFLAAIEQDPLWPSGSLQSTTPSSGLGTQHGTNLVPPPVYDFGSIIGVPNNFDWVCE